MFLIRLQELEVGSRGQGSAVRGQGSGVRKNHAWRVTFLECLIGL